SLKPNRRVIWHGRKDSIHFHLAGDKTDARNDPIEVLHFQRFGAHNPIGYAPTPHTAQIASGETHDASGGGDSHIHARTDAATDTIPPKFIPSPIAVVIAPIERIPVLHLSRNNVTDVRPVCCVAIVVAPRWMGLGMIPIHDAISKE